MSRTAAWRASACACCRWQGRDCSAACRLSVAWQQNQLTLMRAAAPMTRCREDAFCAPTARMREATEHATSLATVLWRRESHKRPRRLSVSPQALGSGSHRPGKMKMRMHTMIMQNKNCAKLTNTGRLVFSTTGTANAGWKDSRTTSWTTEHWKPLREAEARC